MYRLQTLCLHVSFTPVVTHWSICARHATSVVQYLRRPPAARANLFEQSLPV